MPTRPPVFRPAHARTRQQQQRDYNQDRGSPSVRGYGRDWQKVRAAHLAEHPLCSFCEAVGRVTAATVVDHIQTIEAHPDLRLEPSNLRSCCVPCHNSRTARDQGGQRRRTP